MENNSDRLAGIYVHIPFCLKKCSYCDFYSLPVVTRKFGIIDEYLNSMVKEIELKASNYADTEIKTVYLGGGTPSLLNHRQFSLILNTIKINFKLATNAEITLEANPATMEEDQLQSFLDAGLNRLSLGVQSFSDSELSLLGRSHNVEQIIDTLDLISKLNIKNFNLDLIYGLPHQTLEQWLYNLEMATSFEPSHISTYLLQLDPKTPLGRKTIKGEVSMLDDESEWIMYNKGINLLEKKAYKQYEISNFSKQNYESRHNIIYWSAHEYLGLGAGAVTFLNGVRSINKPKIADYISYLAAGQVPPQETLEVMDKTQLVQDAIILGLRLTEGIHIDEFKHRFKVDLLSQYQKPITDSMDKKLLKLENGYLKLSKKGYFLSNQVLYQFIGD